MSRAGTPGGLQVVAMVIISVAVVVVVVVVVVGTPDLSLTGFRSEMWRCQWFGYMVLFICTVCIIHTLSSSLCNAIGYIRLPSNGMVFMGRPPQGILRLLSSSTVAM